MSPITATSLNVRDLGIASKLTAQLTKSCANTMSIMTPFTNQQDGRNYVFIPGGIPVGLVDGDTSNFRLDLNYDPIKCLLSGQSEYQLSLAVGSDVYQCTSFTPTFHLDAKSPYEISCNIAAASLPDDTDITLSVTTSAGYTRAVGTVHTFVATPAQACAKSLAKSLALKTALPQTRAYSPKDMEDFAFALPYNKYACSFDNLNIVFAWGSLDYQFSAGYYFLDKFEHGPVKHVSEVGTVSGKFGAASDTVKITTGVQIPTRGAIQAAEYSINIFVVDQPNGPFTFPVRGFGPVPGIPYRFYVKH